MIAEPSTTDCGNRPPPWMEGAGSRLCRVVGRANLDNLPQGTGLGSLREGEELKVVIDCCRWLSLSLLLLSEVSLGGT